MVFRLHVLGFRVQGSGFRVQGSGFRVDTCTVNASVWTSANPPEARALVGMDARVPSGERWRQHDGS